VQLQCGPLLTVLSSCCYSERNASGEENLQARCFLTVNYSELSSTRDYPEDSDRLEVRVPTVGKPSKSEGSDTQESERCEEVQSFFK
jgi:hypothetical protein